MYDVHVCSSSSTVILPSHRFYNRDLPFFRTPKHIKSTRNITFFPIRKSSSRHSCRLETSAFFRKQDSTSTARTDGKDSSEVVDDDFATVILRENPCQIEAKYLTKECRLLTAKEKKKSNSNGFVRVVSMTLKQIGFKFPFSLWNIYIGKEKDSTHKESAYLNTILRWCTYKRKESGVEHADPVYLNDILREYKGQLYVPEQIFSMNFSEEDDFNRNLEELPKMNFLDFKKHMKYEKIKLLISKGDADTVGKDFVVDLEEIPGKKCLHRTKWAMKLDEKEACALIAEYKGPRHEIEKHYMCSEGKLLVYPNSVTISIFSRVLAELGMITSILIAAVSVIIKAFTLPMFAIGHVVYVSTVNMLWPISRQICNFYTDSVVEFFLNVWEFAIDLFSEGGFFSHFFQIFANGGISDSIEMLKPILLVSVTMVLLIRFTLSRRPKNFKLWDIWQALDFAKSKAEARVDGSTGVKFNDVAGIDEAVEELQELVRYLKNPKLFDEMGIKPPHGVLLEGPPGCGKTLVAKAIAGEAGVPFYQMAGSEFVEVLVGVGSARVRDLFKRAKVNNPSVIFVDEIDAMATKRQEVFDNTEDHIYNAATQERETTLNQLLIELDGFDTGKGVIFLAATNRMDLLDPALLRPGRFDRKIRIRLPNVEGRLGILKIHAKKVKMSETVDLSTYAKNLPGWTGAMLAQLIQEAALIALRNGKKSILPSHINNAVDRLTVGPVRHGLELGHQGQCRRATTEVGVALTSHLLRRFENAKVERCDRVSVTPRGETLSQLVFHRLDDESYKFERRPQLLHRLQVFLGGRAAEEVIYGHDLSLASLGYLADASWLARKILTIWNMDNPMVMHGEGSPWKKEFKFVGPRLDFEGELYDDYGLVESPLGMNSEDEVARRTDKLIKDMYERTRSLLRKHHVALLKTIKVLLHHKEISGEDIDFILDRYPPETPASSLFAEENPGIIPINETDLSK